MLLLRTWRAWTTPTTDGELARRREAVLLSTLAGMVALSLVTQALQLTTLLLNGFAPSGWWLSNVATGAGCYGLLRLARAGRPRAAACGLLTILAFAALALLVASGTVNPMPLLLLALILLLSAILLGGRAALAVFIPTAIGLIAIVLLEQRDVLPLQPLNADPHAPAEAVALSSVLAFMTIVLWLYTRDVLTSVDEALTHSNPGSPLRRMRTKTLTLREIEVVQLVAEGLSNDKIGQRLFVSPRTVQTHVANAMRKAGCANRTELGVLALREGLVPLHEPTIATRPTQGDADPSAPPDAAQA